MSKSEWSCFGGKRFDFSAIKRGKVEYLVAGVLGVVIILAAWGIFAGISTGGGPKPPDFLMFKCDPNSVPKGCGNEFQVKPKDLPRAKNSGDEMNVMKLDCPKCKAVKSSWRMTECPNCKKYFIAFSTRMHYEGLRTGRGDPPGVRDMCDWCKTDLTKWYIAHQPKAPE